MRIFMMSSWLKVGLSLILIIVSIFGILDAGYMTYSELTGHLPPCSPPFDCGTVLNSPWAYLGKVPLSAIGVGYYSTVLLLGILSYFDRRILDFPKKVRFYTEDVLVLLTTGGILFSAYLVFIMGVVLKAWCLYCLFSAGFSVLLFILAVSVRALFMRERPSPMLSFPRSVFRCFYQWIAKPLFFLFDAELVHNQMTTMGKFLGRFAFTRAMIHRLFAYPHPSLPKKIDGILFPNPVGLSAGFDYNAELTAILPSVGFGFATIGTVTLQAYEGNPQPRLGRFPKSQALLVNKGFKSLGARAIIKKLQHQKFTIPVGISIGSTNTPHPSFSAQMKDIIESFRLFESSKVRHSYYELNISCPNIAGSLSFTTADRLEKLLQMLDRLNIKKPVYIKMPIDLPTRDTLSLLDVAKEHRIAGVIFGNLTKDKTNPDVAPEDQREWLKVAGNVSGKPTWNRSNKFIKLTRQTYKSRFTIIGTGGIFSPEDAETKIKLGADVVQLITGMIYEGPQLIGDITQYLATKKQ